MIGCRQRITTGEIGIIDEHVTLPSNIIAVLLRLMSPPLCFTHHTLRLSSFVSFSFHRWLHTLSLFIIPRFHLLVGPTPMHSCQLSFSNFCAKKKNDILVFHVYFTFYLDYTCFISFIC